MQYAVNHIKFTLCVAIMYGEWSSEQKYAVLVLIQITRVSMKSAVRALALARVSPSMMSVHVCTIVCLHVSMCTVKPVFKDQSKNNDRGPISDS